MRILKLKGKTEEAVLKQIEKEYGSSAIVINTQKEEAAGAFKWFKPSKTVITIAVKEDDDKQPQEMTEEKSVSKENEEHASYEILMELKNQLGKIHEEVTELKKDPLRSHYEVEGQRLDAAGRDEEYRTAAYLKSKLVNLGLKPEMSEALISEIKAEDSEGFIRELYNLLENILQETEEKELPQVVFFIGSTGVGKTTTIAKLTAKYVLEEQKKVVLLTSDTYRIAAVEQLKTYADILGVQIEVIYDENELPQYIEKWKHMDHILIDTAGRSHKNEEQVIELKGLMQNVSKKQVFLVLNASTSAKDVQKIVATYEKAEQNFDLILTKLDETDEIGNIVNINYYAQKPIKYLTNGQNVPADIEAFNKQKYITELLGRLNDE